MKKKENEKQNKNTKTKTRKGGKKETVNKKRIRNRSRWSVCRKRGH